MGVLIKQLHDDLAAFYPITTVDAVVGGTITSAGLPDEIDLSSYITDDFKTDDDAGIFKMLIYHDSFTYIALEVSKNPNYWLRKGGENVIAKGMPVAYFPERPIVMKTLTDDTNSKCDIIWDVDGYVRLVVVPNEEVTVNENVVNITQVVDINVISAVAIAINGVATEDQG